MSTYYIQTDITLEEKAIFSKNLSPGNIYYSFDYIPGSVLWGMCASLFPKSDMQKFYETFFQDKVIFTNLYPFIGADIVALPLPLSTFGCKHRPGWTERSVISEKHKFYDYLLGISKIDVKCQKCSSEKKSFTNGFYYKKGNTYYSYNTEKTIDMHNHIDDELQTTKTIDGLYSYEVLTKGQKFIGYILLHGEWDEFKEINRLIDSIKNGRRISIGKGRNNGYGLSTIDFINYGESYKLDSNKRLYISDKLDLSKNKHGFTLTLLSDLFFKDNYGNYFTYIDEILLSNILNNGLITNFKPEEFKLIRSFCRSKEIDGFNIKHNLPKNKMIGLQKGSAFYFDYIGSEYNKLNERLLEIERNGVGIRKSEGYGIVAINLPYHKENIE
jgi:CRISPR-associated Csx10 family RAMP protein